MARLNSMYMMKVPGRQEGWMVGFMMMVVVFMMIIINACI